MERYTFKDSGYTHSLPSLDALIDSAIQSFNFIQNHSNKEIINSCFIAQHKVFFPHHIQDETIRNLADYIHMHTRCVVAYDHVYNSISIMGEF